MPFDGELMECSLCDAEQQHDPEARSDWRAMQFPGEDDVYYVCPAHFPPDGAGVDAFREAYLEVFIKLAELRGQDEGQLGEALVGLRIEVEPLMVRPEKEEER
jgi:hypothetical protein